jgi:hypothetical protein
VVVVGRVDSCGTHLVVLLAVAGDGVGEVEDLEAAERVICTARMRAGQGLVPRRRAVTVDPSARSLGPAVVSRRRSGHETVRCCSSRSRTAEAVPPIGDVVVVVSG